jgi:hypothetical protein
MRAREAQFRGGGEQIDDIGRLLDPRCGSWGNGKAVEYFLPGQPPQRRGIFAPFHRRECRRRGRICETGIADEGEAVEFDARLVRAEIFSRRGQGRGEDACDAEQAQLGGLPAAVAVVADLGRVDDFERRARGERKHGRVLQVGAQVVEPEGVDLLQLVVGDEEPRRKKPVEIEADDGVNAVVEDEFVPLRDHGVFIGFAARRAFLFDFARGPAEEPGIAANRIMAEPVQGPAKVS